MSLSCGFYNSENGDREYFNEDLSNFLEGLITDGIFETLGDKMMVQAASTLNMTVNVGTGRAWFNATWTKIDALYSVGISASDPVQSRIDAICLTVNKTRAVRDNYIEIIEGPGAVSNPQKPIVEDETNIYRHVLAYVTIPAGATVITQAQIENRVGMGSALFSAPKWGNVPTTEQMAAQWESQFDQMMSGDRTEFDTFMTYVHNTFDYDAATGLQSEIDAIIEYTTGIVDVADYSSNVLRLTVNTSSYPNFNLQKGTHLIHHFTQDWEAQSGNYGISVNGSTAYDLWRTDGTRYGSRDQIIKAGMTAEFLFDGSSWRLLSTELLNMKATFQDGVDAVYNAVVAAGVVPASSTPSAIAEAISNLRTTPYTETYTFPSGDTGGTKDLGVPHDKRYVNAGNVYNKGVSVGHADKNTKSIRLSVWNSGTGTSGTLTGSDGTTIKSWTFVDVDEYISIKTSYNNGATKT